MINGLEDENDRLGAGIAGEKSEKQAWLDTDQTSSKLRGLAELSMQSGASAQEMTARAREISGELALIRSIAEQTKLLALNAAIEAAHCLAITEAHGGNTTYGGIKRSCTLGPCLVGPVSKGQVAPIGTDAPMFKG